MQDRRDFIGKWLDQQYETFAGLCGEYDISRETGYKWIARFKEGGLAGLESRKRGTGSHPWATDDLMVRQIVALRRRRPRWGPKKLCAWLQDAGYQPPAPSTVGSILKREGLVRPQKRRRPRPGNYASTLSPQDKPNAVWAVDFKGWFRLASGKKCYPLTVSDGYSRYLIGCEALEHPDELACREAFERLFGQFGLPDVIRSDNGTPFSGTYGVSSLSVWWIKLGIRPERITRGRPSENGRHERMHRTLKQDAIESAPLGRRMIEQQRIFDQFRHEYNDERPHEALGQKPPATVYESSSKCYPKLAVSPRYPEDWSVHQVRSDGTILLPGKTLKLSAILRGEPVGLEPRADGSRRIYYGPLVLGNLSISGKFTRGTRSPRAKQQDPPAEELKAVGKDKAVRRGRSKATKGGTYLTG